MGLDYSTVAFDLRIPSTGLPLITTSKGKAATPEDWDELDRFAASLLKLSPAKTTTSPTSAENSIVVATSNQ